MNELITVDYNSERPTVSARELHELLEIKTAFTDWFPRMCEYGFEEGKDYCSFLSDRSDGLPGKPRTEYQLTIEMAKELCMIQRNDKGREIRRYFIDLEEKWNSPEMVINRALQFSQRQVEALMQKNNALIEENSVMKPKAEYYDNIIDRGASLNFGDTAKLIGVQRKALINELFRTKYIYRDGYGDIRAYQSSINSGLLKQKQFYNERNGHSGIQVLVTPKGIEMCMNLMRAKNSIPPLVEIC